MYIPKEKVPSSILEPKEVEISKESPKIFQVETASIKGKVDDVSLDSAESISLSSLSKLETNINPMKEDKSEVLGVNEENQKLETFLLIEWELEQVLEIAPFLDRAILNEEDIKKSISFL